jgi:hypothetical protein
MGAIARRLFAAVKEGRLASGLKRRLKPAARRLARAVVQRSALRRAALSSLVLVPWLKPRLRTLLSGSSIAADSAASLSPSAQRVYRRLQRAQHYHKSS